MPPSFRLDDAVALLARTPALLTAWLDGLPPAWTDATLGEGTWSAHEVVGHLLHGERTDWVPRVRHLLRHGEAVPFPPFDREAMRAGPRVPLATLLRDFAAARADGLAELAALQLGEADLDRPGTHPAFGRVTLGQLLATWVAHDQTHIRQVARTMARRYHDDVGPWRAYLSILTE